MSTIYFTNGLVGLPSCVDRDPAVLTQGAQGGEHVNEGGFRTRHRLFEDGVFAQLSGPGRLHHRQDPPSQQTSPVLLPAGNQQERGLSQATSGSCGVLCCSSLPTSTGLHLRAVDIAVFHLRKWDRGGDDSSTYLHVFPGVELNRCLFAVLMVYGAC